MVPDVSAWAAWAPGELAARLSGVTAPWCVAAGWAVDLFHGEVTRPHDDIEIAVPAGRFTEIADRFPDCDFYVPHGGRLVPATADALRSDFQTWALERATGRWRFDVFREPHDGDVWLCRRDGRLRLPYAEVIRHDADGVPYLSPEIALFFKAKGTREKDQADFDRTHPLLSAGQRRWLRDALALAHPGHEWAATLASG